MATNLRRACALVGVLTALMAWAPPPVHSAPVRTVLAARSGDGAWRFLADLAELWRNRYEPTNERLALRAVDSPQQRLQRLSRGRADFALVDAATAARQLAQHPRLTTVAVLWPNLLQAVSRNPRARELSLPLPTELWVLDSADFAYRSLAEAIGGDRGQAALLQRVPQSVLVDSLDYAQDPILLFSAPSPLLEVVEGQRRDPRLQILPIASRLVDELKLANPWLVTEKLERSAYPAQGRNLELPAVYQVLIGGRDLPVPTVRKVLDTVYGRSNAMALFDPLFGQLDGRMNAVFGKLLPFHPATARRFNFTPSVP